MFNFDKNYIKNNHIVPVENYYLARTRNIKDKRVRNWTIAACAAAELLFDYVMFDLNDDNNLFYSHKKTLQQMSFHKLFKVLVVFYLHLYFKDIEVEDSFIADVCRVFDITDKEIKNLLTYSLMDEQNDDFDYSNFSNEVKQYFKSSKISPATMMHLYGLLIEAGFDKDIENRTGDLLILIKISDVASLFFQTSINKV